MVRAFCITLANLVAVYACLFLFFVESSFAQARIESMSLAFVLPLLGFVAGSFRHRAIIADWLKVRGVEVLHILSENKVEPHPYTSAARIIDGQLSYRAPREDATPAELPLS